jgi:hypothetical protein
LERERKLAAWEPEELLFVAPQGFLQVWVQPKRGYTGKLLEINITI